MRYSGGVRWCCCWWWCLLGAAAAAESTNNRTLRSVRPHAFLAPLLWEQFAEALAAALRTVNYQAMHFLCGPEVCPSKPLLRRLSRAATMSYTMTRPGPEELQSFGTLPPFNVFLVLDLNGTEACELVRNLTGRTSGLVTMVSTLPREEFLSQMGETFEKCWRHDMLTVLAAHVKTAQGDPSMDIYTYFPYREGKCLEMWPEYLFTWRIGEQIEIRSLHITKKINRLHKCPLRVVTFEAIPWVRMTKNDEPSKFTITGTYGPLMYAVEEGMNFSAVFSQPTDGQLYGDANDPPVFGGLVGDVFYNRSDLGLAFSSGELIVPYHARPSTAQVI